MHWLAVTNRRTRMPLRLTLTKMSWSSCYWQPVNASYHKTFSLHFELSGFPSKTEHFKFQFSSRWYLCAWKSPYVLHPVSQKFPQITRKKWTDHLITDWNETTTAKTATTTTENSTQSGPKTQRHFHLEATVSLTDSGPRRCPGVTGRCRGWSCCCPPSIVFGASRVRGRRWESTVTMIFLD